MSFGLSPLNGRNATLNNFHSMIFGRVIYQVKRMCHRGKKCCPLFTV